MSKGTTNQSYTGIFILATLLRKDLGNMGDFIDTHTAFDLSYKLLGE